MLIYVCSLFMTSLTMRTPSEYLAIDKTSYSYLGHVKLKQYNPNKPAKPGLLYSIISDSTLSNTYFTLPYCGKPEEESSPFYITSTDKYTIYLVKNRSKNVDSSGRNISMDRFFTSISIAEYLLAKNATVMGH